MQSTPNVLQTPAPSVAGGQHAPLASSQAGRIGSLALDLMRAFYHEGLRICRGDPRHPAAAEEPAQLSFSYTSDPALTELAAEHLREINAQRAEQDLKLREESLLNAAFHNALPVIQGTLATACEKLRTCLSWKRASLADYGASIPGSTPSQQEALTQWEASYEALKRACKANPDGYKEHARSTYEAIRALALPKNEGRVVYYAGACGKKRTLIQALLTRVYSDYKTQLNLPEQLKSAIESGALDSLEELLSCGCDLFLQKVLEENPERAPLEELRTKLELLKPLLPDLKRHTRHGELLKAALPECLQGASAQLLDQGLLSIFLDLVPDSLLRDACVDLVNLLSEGAHAEDLQKCMQGWKAKVIEKAVAQLPLDSLTDMHEMLEEGVSSLLKGFDHVAEGLGGALEKQVNSSLFTDGTYWLSFSYDHKQRHYNVSVYASGSCLNHPEYPSDAKGNPYWPIRLTGFRPTSSFPDFLTRMSAGTALSKGYAQQPKTLKPLAFDLFGEHGLLAVLKSMGKELRTTTLGAVSSRVSDLDMVSYYCNPDDNPAQLRYRALRQTLLEVCTFLGKKPSPELPAVLEIPQEQQAVIIPLLESALKTLRREAEKAELQPAAFKEIRAFEQQLEAFKQAQQKPFEQAPTSGKSLGLLFDWILQGLCASAGELHPLREYRTLLIFLLGEDSEGFIDLLIQRADELQAQVRPQVEPTAQPAPDAASTPPEHRPRGIIGNLLYQTPAARLCLKVLLNLFYIQQQLTWFVSYGYGALGVEIFRNMAPHILPKGVQAQLEAVYSYVYTHIARGLRELIFSIVFPHLENNTTLIAFQDRLAPFIKAFAKKRAAEITLVSPAPAIPDLPAAPTTTLTHVIAQLPLSAVPPIAIKQHAWVQAQSVCEEMQLANVLLVELSYKLSRWKEQGQHSPHLLMHYIHTLPILPACPHFQRFFGRNLLTNPRTVEHVKDSLHQIDEIAALLYSQYTKKTHAISWREYLLAQYRLLAFADLWIRQFPDHPFDAPLDANPLLEELSASWRDCTYMSLYPESEAHAATVLRYYYPDLSLQELIDHPPSSQQRLAWSKERWFGYDGSDYSFEKKYYQKVIQEAESSGKAYLYLARNPDQDAWLTDPTPIERSHKQKSNDLLYIAHADPEETRAFEHPLHWTVLFAARLIDCARCVRIGISKDSIPISLHTRLQEEESIDPSSYNILSPAHIALEHYAIDLISKPKTSKTTLSFCSQSHTKKPNIHAGIFVWPAEKCWQLWKQEFSAVNMTQEGAESENPLTGPSRALTLMVLDPRAATLPTPFYIIKQLLLCTGSITKDFKENPALIQNYAGALEALLNVPNTDFIKLQIIELSLALRARAWQVRPDTTAFDFLQKALLGLNKNTWHLRTLALNALYRDHPHPLACSTEKQKETLSYLLSALSQCTPQKDAFIVYEGASKHLAALEQMALRWYPCMQQMSEETVAGMTLDQTSLPPTEQDFAQHWQRVAKNYGIEEIVLPGRQPLTNAWIKIQPSMELCGIYSQRAHLHRRLNGASFTLMTDPKQCKGLLKTISEHFHRLGEMQNPQCWMQQQDGPLIEGAHVSLLVTSNDQQSLFALEYVNKTFHLLGLSDPESGQVLFPATSEQIRQTCFPLARFCPLASMTLLINRKTQKPAKVLMPSLQLDLTFTEYQEGDYRLENPQRFPGFWVSSKQSVPFGLVLENEEGQTKLLLPEATLPIQALYAKLDPLFGVLGTAIQQIQALHKSSKLYVYERVGAHWESPDPYAMVHLLLLFFLESNKKAFRHTGNALLRMPLPEGLENALLPLHFTTDKRVRHLHARLLAHIETSRLACVEEIQEKSLISRYLPLQATRLLGWMSVYRSLALENNSEEPLLQQPYDDPILHTLFARHRRLLHEHQDLLKRFSGFRRMTTCLTLDCIALRMLPPRVQARILPQERLIGNPQGLFETCMQYKNVYSALPAFTPFQHPWIQQAQKIYYTFKPSSTTSLCSALVPAMKRAFFQNCIHIAPSHTAPPIELDQLMQASRNFYATCFLSLEPETLTQETLVPYFITYLEMAKGMLGTSKQTRLLPQLYLMYWSGLQGIEQDLLLILLAINAHPSRYSAFKCLRYRKTSLQERLIEYKSTSAALKTHTETVLPTAALFQQESPLVKQAAEKRQNLMNSLSDLKLYTELQPKWNRINLIGKGAIYLFGTCYVLPTLSQQMLSRAVSTTTSYLPESPADALQIAAPIGLTAGLASYLLYKKGAHQPKLKKLKNALESVDQTAARYVPCKSITKVGGAALTVFGTQCLVQYTSKRLFDRASESENDTCPEPAQSVFLKTLMLAVVPTVTSAYMLHRFYRAHKQVRKQLQSSQAQGALNPSTPSISPACQKTLDSENKRWNTFLDQLLNSAFIIHSVPNVAITLEAVQSNTIKHAMQCYADQTAGSERTLTSLRSLPALKQLHRHIEKALSDVEQFQKQELKTLFDILKIHPDDEDEALEAFRRFLIVGTETDFFKDHPVSHHDLLSLQEILPTFFLHETQKQQLERINKALQQVKRFDPEQDKQKWELACEALSTQLRARRVYDISSLNPKRLAHFLAFECATSTLLWQAQFDTLSAVLDVQGQGVTYELLMSLGKTFFAIPMTALAKADGENLVVILWPPPVFVTQTQETGEQLFKLAARPITPLSINRSFSLTLENLDNLLRLFESTKQHKGAISTRASDIKALFLLLITKLKKFSKLSTLNSKQTAQAAKMQRLLYTLMTHGVYIGDESHELFGDVDMHFPLGPKKKIDPKEASVVRSVVQELLKSDLGTTLRTCTHLNAKEGMDALFTLEKKRIVHKIVSGNWLCGSIPEDARDEVAHYLLNKDVDVPEYLNNPVHAPQLSQIDAARGVLLFIFPLFFTRTIDGDFTQSLKLPDLESVIPCGGNQNPAEHKRITTPHEALAKTLIYRWHRGLSAKRLQKLLGACDARSRKWAKTKSLPCKDSPDAILFKELFPENSDITLEKAAELANNPEAVKDLFAPIQGSLDLLLLYSRRVLEPTLEYQPWQASMSAQDLNNCFKEGNVCSGTPNKGIYPHGMKQLMNDATMGEAIAHMKNKCPEGGIRELSKETPRELLAEVLEKFPEGTALIDGGDLFTGIPHIDVARAFLNAAHAKKPQIKAVDFFELDPQTGETCRKTLLLDAEKSIPFEACQLPLEAFVAYFDKPHCYAANLRQPLDGKGIWLVGEGHPLSRALQDIFRLRRLKERVVFLGLAQDEATTQQTLETLHERDLLSSHSLYIALSPQVARAIRLKTNAPPTLENVLDYGAAEEEARMDLQAGLSMLRADHKKHPLKALIKPSNSVSEVLQHFRASHDLFVTSTAQTATKLYGGKRVEMAGKDLVDAAYAESLISIDRNKKLTKDEKAAAKADLAKTYEHVSTLKLPQKVSVRRSEKGEHCLDLEEMSHESLGEQERAAEREAEHATERTLSLKSKRKLKSLGLKPKPWSKTCPLDSSQWHWMDVFLSENHSSFKYSIKEVWKKLSATGKSSKTKTPLQAVHSPALFHLYILLQHANKVPLRALSAHIDPRIWVSNHLLPQVDLPFNAGRSMPATDRQEPITHLLVEVDPTFADSARHILSIGCLGTSDVEYWKKRLQKEHGKQRAGAAADAHSDTKRLYFLYQMPGLANLSLKEHYDKAILAVNQDTDYPFMQNPDFQRLETMIKFCNGDENYTPEQCHLLRGWQAQFPSKARHIMDQAFSLFHNMASERVGLQSTRTFESVVNFDPEE